MTWSRTRLVGVYLPFLLFHAASVVYEAHSGPIPWHPTAGLVFSLFLIAGLSAAPVAIIGAFLGTLALDHQSGVALGFLPDALILTAGYGLAAKILHRLSENDLTLRSVKDISLFVLVALVASLAVAIATVWVPGPPEPIQGTADLAAVLAFWLQDSIAVLTLPPLILLLRGTAVGSRKASHRTREAEPGGVVHHARFRPGPRLVIFHQTLSVLAVLWLNFGIEGRAELDLYYFLLLPLVWVALRWGLIGAAICVVSTNLGASVAIEVFSFSPSWLPELQVLMMTVALTGLFLGATVTTLRRTQIRLQKSKDAAEAASRAKSAFLANINHELRTPMNSILGFTELVLDEVEGPITVDQRTSLERVQKHSRNLLGLIDDILDVSRLQAGFVTPDTGGFRLTSVIDSVLKVLLPRAEGKGLRLVGAVSPDVPDRLLGDEMHLRRVLGELIENSIKFTDAGEVKVEVRTKIPARREICLHFVVRDTGIGILEDRKAAVFEVFSQSDESSTREYQGPGVGLAVAAQLVRLMGGRIWLESTEGTGSAFHFTAWFALGQEGPDTGTVVTGPRGPRDGSP